MCVTVILTNFHVFDFKATLPFKAIDVLAMITIGQVTGRRKFELLTIVPSDIQLNIIRVKEDVVVRELRLTYCWKKNLGVGKYQQVIVGNSKLENDAISFILLKAQHQGMIKSAVDVYRGDETLCVDDSLYESPDLLQRKLRDAANALNKKQREQFEHGLDEPSRSLLCTLIDKECVEDIAHRIPFWVAVDVSLGSVTSKRMTDSTANEYISKMICKTERNKNHHGYVSSPKNKIGITSTRKSFRTNTSGAVSGNANFDLQNHLSKHASHTVTVGHEYYEDEMEYQKMIPANIQQVGDQATADAIMMRIEHPALYEQAGYHVVGHHFYTDPLPDPEDFLEEQSMHATPNGLGAIRCPVDNCDHNKTYRFYADYACHLRECHMKNEKVSCPACQMKISLAWFSNKHTLHNGNSGMCKVIESNVFARKPVHARKMAAKSIWAEKKEKKQTKSDAVEQPKAPRKRKSQRKTAGERDYSEYFNEDPATILGEIGERAEL